MSHEEYEGEERRQHCSPDNRCSDMVRTIEWGKATRFFMGGGITLFVLFSGANTWFQYSGTQSQAITAAQVSNMSKKLDALQSTVDFLGERMYFVQRKQELQDYDTQITRYHMNEVFKRLGINDPISTTPFEPPDFPEMSQKLKDLREQAKNESKKH